MQFILLLSLEDPILNLLNQWQQQVSKNIILMKEQCNGVWNTLLGGSGTLLPMQIHRHRTSNGVACTQDFQWDYMFTYKHKQCLWLRFYFYFTLYNQTPSIRKFILSTFTHHHHLSLPPICSVFCFSLGSTQK